MAHGTRVNNTAYGVTGGKCLVGGTEYSIKKGRTLVSGTGYDITFGTPLSAYGEGDTVFINENGSPVEFYIAKHDYESGLNGIGRTLLVRKYLYDLRAWNSVDVNTYANSSIDNWLNNTYFNVLSSRLRSLIGSTKFYYTVGGGNDRVTTLDRSVFLLSATELGLSSILHNVEGTALPIAEDILIAKVDSGDTEHQWTRSPDVWNGTEYAISITTRGKPGGTKCSISKVGSRPAFTLPSSVTVSDDMLIA